MSEYILVVDDSATIRASVQFILQQGGYEVTLANDGVDGIEKLKDITRSNDAVKMIITDINMPRMDGITFLQKVKASSFRSTPVLILTTESGEERKKQGREAGAAGWLVKPFQPEQLLAVINKLVN